LKKGFSLIELMIVIVIMGVVYTLALTKLKMYNPQNKPSLSLQTLKPYLYDLAKDGGVAKVACFNGCQECVVLLDGKKVQAFENFLTSKEPQLYTYNYFNGMTSYTPTPLFDDNGIEQSVCFEMEVDSHKVATQLIVEERGKVYDYTPYFHDVVVYNSLQEAINAKEKLIEEVR
jgi:prepilin-type N-terminal cleavage/methylation domain-containing protein